MRRAALGCLLALALAGPAAAQGVPGTSGGGSTDPTGFGGVSGAAPSSGLPDPNATSLGGESSFSQGSAPRGGAQTPLAAPDQLFGLKHGDDRPVITLEDALERALSHSWDLRIARERVVQQEAAVRRAWSLLLPQVTLSGTYTLNCTTSPGQPLVSDDARVRTLLDCRDVRTRFVTESGYDAQIQQLEAFGTIIEQAAGATNDPDEQAALQQQADELFTTADRLERERGERIKPIVVQPANVFGGALNVSVPLFNGRAIPVVQNAYSSVDAVGLVGNQAREAQKLAVTRAYYAAFTARKLVSIASEQRDSAQRHKEAVQTRVELETLPPLALRRARLDLIRAEQSVRQAEAGYRAAISALGALTGIEEYFDVVEPPPVAPVENEGTMQELIERAADARPDLRAQRLAVTIADRNKLDAWMMFLPSVNLVAQSRLTSNTQGFVDVPISNALVLQANVPLYDGGARYAALKDSSSRVREELMKVRQLEERIAGQVRGNLEELRVRTESLALAREAVEVSKESAAQAQTLYEAGAATSLDVSDTQLSVFISEVELARAELDVEQARLGLAYVIGALPVVEAEPARFDAGEEAAARARVEGRSPAP